MIPEIAGLAIREVLRPRFAPMGRDAVTDEKLVDGTVVFPHRFDVSLVKFQPRVSAEMAGGDLRPEFQQVFLDLASGTAFVLKFVDDVGALLRRERPAGLLRLVGDVRIHESVPGGDGKREQAKRQRRFIAGI